MWADCTVYIIYINTILSLHANVILGLYYPVGWGSSHTRKLRIRFVLEIINTDLHGSQLCVGYLGRGNKVANASIGAFVTLHQSLERLLVEHIATVEITGVVVVVKGRRERKKERREKGSRDIKGKR